MYIQSLISVKILKIIFYILCLSICLSNYLFICLSLKTETMKLEITCTRAEANHKQLQNCMDKVSEMAPSFQKVSKLLSITGNEVRLKILFLLNMEKELCPCDLADILKMSVPAVSQHIRKMKDASVISARRERQTIYYSLNEDEKNILNSVFKSIELKRKTA